MNKLNAKKIILLSMIMSSMAHAGYTVNSQVSIGMPEIETEIKESLVAFVNEGVVSFKAKEDSLCSISDNFNQSGVKSGKLNCYIEIIDIPQGLIQKDLSIVGIPLVHGQKTVKTNTYFKSGENNEKVLLKTDNWVIDIAKPEEPKVVKISTVWNVGEKTGTEMVTHNRADHVKDFVIEVEPRPYEQVFVVEGQGECDIPKMGTKCGVNENLNFPSSLGDSGIITKKLSMTSKNNYFNNQVSELSFIYDFTPPLLSDFNYKALYEKNINFNKPVYSLDYSIENNYAALTIKSPYIGVVEPRDVNPVKDWFLPDNEKMFLKLTPVDKNGQLIETLKDFYVYSEFVEMNAERAIYKFDLSKIPEGFFLPTISATDKHKNKSVDLKPEMMKLDRTPPIIFVKRNGRMFDGGDIYSFAELSFMATDGIHDNPKIDSLSYATKSIELVQHEKDLEWVRSVEPELRSINPNTKDVLTVKAYDANGNEGVWAKDVNFLPVVFSLNPEHIAKVYQRITDAKIPVIQTGVKCYPTTTEGAINMAKYGDFTCAMEKIEVPLGIIEKIQSKTFFLTGQFENDGLNKVAFDIFTYNKYGDKIFAGNVTQDINVMKPRNPPIDFVPTNPYIKTDFVQISTVGSLIGKLFVTSFKETTVSVAFTNENIEDSIFKMNGRMSDVEKTAMTTLGVSYDGVEKGKVWEEGEIDINVAYTDFPEITSNKKIKTINVPPFERLKLTVTGRDEDNTIFDKDTYSLTLNLGITEPGRPGYFFDETYAGQWNLFLAEYDADKNLVPVTEKKLAKQDGVTFDLKNLKAGERNFIPVAELISPYPELQKTILGSRIYTMILNTGAINGTLSQTDKNGLVPMYTRTKLGTLEQTYQRSLGDIKWEESYDLGKTWAQIPQEKALISHTKVIEQEGTYSVRAQLFNKYNPDSTSYTEAVHYRAVTVPQFIINSPNTAFDNDIVRIKPELADPTIELPVVYYYSEDNGRTWKEMTTDYIETTGKIGDVKNFVFKARFEQSPVDFEKGYYALKHQVAFAKYRAPKVNITSSDYRFEVGQTYDILATTIEPYSNMRKEIKFEFILPNGDIVDKKELKLTPTKEMIDSRGYITIKYRAWIDRYKDTTTLENEVKFKTIDYIWPNFTFSTSTTYPVVPSFQQIIIEPYGLDISYLDNLKYEWILPNGVTEQKAGSVGNMYVAKIISTTPGTSIVKVKISDSRGNEQNLDIPIEAIEAPPVSVAVALKNDTINNVAPYSNFVTASYTGGHKNDKIDYIKWYINGSEQVGKTSFQLPLTALGEGDYEIKAELGMKLSSPAFGVLNLKVNKNQEPSCEPLVVNLEAGRLGRLVANGNAVCTDPDSFLTYAWKNQKGDVLVRKSNISLSVKSPSDLTGLTLEVLSEHGQKIILTPEVKYATGN